MINEAIQWAMTAQITNFVGFVLYWIPVAYCLVGFLMMSIDQYYADRKAREQYLKDPKFNHYIPSLVIGTIVGRFVVSIIPVVNWWPTLFHITPFMFRNVFMKMMRWFEKALDIPLVPTRKLTEEQFAEFQRDREPLKRNPY